MIKGITTLDEIEEIIYTLRNEIERLDGDIDELFAASQKNKEMQANSIHELSMIRFSEIKEGKITQRVEHIEEEVNVLLKKRAVSYNELHKKIAESKNDLNTFSEKRVKAHELLNDVAQNVINKEKKVQKFLENDEAYQVQLEKTRNARDISKQANDKSIESENTRIEKGKPYEESELFMYLWRLSYGTVEYKNSGLIKMLDAWVASIVEYEKHRVNYWTLLEIPKRLKIHAEKESEKYRSEVDILSDIEHAQAKALGLDVLQKEEKYKQEEVDKIDDHLVLLEKVYESLIQERQLFVKDKDEYAVEIIYIFNKTLDEMSMPKLDVLIKQTPTTKDDSILDSLNRLKEKYLYMQNRISENRIKYDKKIEHLKDVEQLKEKFKRNRYDDIRSGFSNENVIQDMIGGLLGGLVQSDILWDTLRRSQRHMDTGSWPDFGSGGLVIESSPWHFPESRDGGSMFNLPDMGGFTSRNTIDGFTTGGGF